MTVELIASNKPESVAVDRFPVLVGKENPSQSETAVPLSGGFHCLISRVGDDLVVWDVGDRRGTFLNGTRVDKATVKAGDTLRLGGTDFAIKGESRPRRYLFGVRG
jgi:hypothetical protein